MAFIAKLGTAESRLANIILGLGAPSGSTVKTGEFALDAAFTLLWNPPATTRTKTTQVAALVIYDPWATRGEFAIDASMDLAWQPGLLTSALLPIDASFGLLWHAPQSMGFWSIRCPFDLTWSSSIEHKAGFTIDASMDLAWDARVPGAGGAFAIDARVSLLWDIGLGGNKTDCLAGDGEYEPPFGAAPNYVF